MLVPSHHCGKYISNKRSKILILVNFYTVMFVDFFVTKKIKAGLSTSYLFIYLFSFAVSVIFFFRLCYLIIALIILINSIKTSRTSLYFHFCLGPVFRYRPTE